MYCYTGINPQPPCPPPHASAPQAMLVGGEVVELLPEGHPGQSELKWSRNKFKPFLFIDPQVRPEAARQRLECRALRQLFPLQSFCLSDLGLTTLPRIVAPAARPLWPRRSGRRGAHHRGHARHHPREWLHGALAVVQSNFATGRHNRSWRVQAAQHYVAPDSSRSQTCWTMNAHTTNK